MRKREKAHLTSNIIKAAQQQTQEQTQQQLQQHLSFFQPANITKKVTELKAYLNDQAPNIVTTAATTGAVALIIAALPVSTEKKWGLSIASLIHRCYCVTNHGGASRAQGDHTPPMTLSHSTSPR